MVSVAIFERDGDQVATCDVRIQERHRAVPLQDPEGEDEEILQQQPAISEIGQPPIIHGHIPPMVQPPEETPRTGKNLSPDAISTVSSSIDQNYMGFLLKHSSLLIMAFHAS